jgi:hypothetical protein
MNKHTADDSLNYMDTVMPFINIHIYLLMGKYNKILCISLAEIFISQSPQFYTVPKGFPIDNKQKINLSDIKAKKVFTLSPTKRQSKMTRSFPETFFSFV